VTSSRLQGQNLEWARTKLEGKNTWYIRLGETGELNPIKIFRLYKKGITVPPSTYIGRRRTTKIVGEALTKILPAKEIKEMLLRYPGVDKDKEEYVNNEESKTEEVENLSDSPEEVKEATNFVLGQGIPPVKYFPFRNIFKKHN
jgi:hypothetical protein